MAITEQEIADLLPAFAERFRTRGLACQFCQKGWTNFLGYVIRARSRAVRWRCRCERRGLRWRVVVGSAWRFRSESGEVERRIVQQERRQVGHDAPRAHAARHLAHQVVDLAPRLRVVGAGRRQLDVAVALRRHPERPRRRGHVASARVRERASDLKARARRPRQHGHALSKAGVLRLDHDLVVEPQRRLRRVERRVGNRDGRPRHHDRLGDLVDPALHRRRLEVPGEPGRRRRVRRRDALGRGLVRDERAPEHVGERLADVAVRAAAREEHRRRELAASVGQRRGGRDDDAVLQLARRQQVEDGVRVELLLDDLHAAEGAGEAERPRVDLRVRVPAAPELRPEVGPDRVVDLLCERRVAVEE